MSYTRREILSRDLYLNLVRVHERLTTEFNALFKREGLTSAQYNVLRILVGGPRGGASCHYIKERLLTRVPDVTRLLDRMESSDLITRERSDEDRRVVLVRVSAKGAKECRRLEGPLMATHLRQLEGVSGKTLTALNDQLTELLDVT